MDETSPTAWCAPLERFGARALADRVPWPITVAEHRLVGQTTRRNRPTVWTYRHIGSGLDLHVDERGRAYRRTVVAGVGGPGRFVEIAPRPAVFEAGLHLVVDPVFADGISTFWFPEDDLGEEEWDEADDEDEPEPVHPRHLVLVPSP